MACVAVKKAPEPLSNEEARVVLEPYFEAVRDDYLAAGLTLVKRVKMSIDPKMHDTARHFAACRDDGSQILLAPQIADLPEPMALALIAHELGHATDFLYPGEFVLGRENAPAARRIASTVEPKQWTKWLKSWQKRDGDVVEFTADAIAHRVMGVAYGYYGPCQIQSFDSARPRPRGLK